jgi:hypothetical protein
MKQHWSTVCARTAVRPLPFEHPANNITYKSLKRQNTATRTIFLAAINQLTAVAKGRNIYTGDLRDFVEASILSDIFANEWAHLIGRSRWNRCRAIWRVMWEFYEVDARWLLVGGRRYRRTIKSVSRDVDPDLISRLSGRGKDMAEAAIAGARAGNLRAALRLRTAAHMCLSAELSGRLSEIALMTDTQIIDNGSQMVALVDGEHSKTNDYGRDPLKPETADIIRKYILYGRPLLLGSGVDGKGRGLWITEEGLDAEAQGMAAALQRATRDIAQDGVSANDIRSSALSKADQTLPEKAQQARHVLGSMTAPIVYAKRDRGLALQKSKEKSAIKPGDLPPAMLPEPRGSVRRAAARASKRGVAKRKTNKPRLLRTK